MKKARRRKKTGQMKRGKGGGVWGEGDSIISLTAPAHLSSNNVVAHLVVVRTGPHWYTAFEA